MISATIMLLSAMNLMAQDKLTVSDFSIKAGETTTVDVILNNSIPYVAFQFDWELPAGITIPINKVWDDDDEEYKDVIAIETPRFKSKHGLTAQNVSGNLWRFVAFANPTQTFKGNSGEAILKVTFKADAAIEAGNKTSKISAIVLTEESNTQHKYDQTGDFPDVSINVTVTGTDGIEEISIDNPSDIYDLQGNKVRSNATSTEGLSKGVYIINGQKVIKK
ncbi:MAG: hypothetical protein IJV17_03790 [Prevotella sp.]|nr:hypothetical protein [Prevotella sp.]